MDYERAMGLLDYVSKTLDQYFNESERKGDSECQKKKPEQKKQRKSSPKKK